MLGWKVFEKASRVCRWAFFFFFLLFIKKILVCFAKFPACIFKVIIIVNEPRERA